MGNFCSPNFDFDEDHINSYRPMRSYRRVYKDRIEYIQPVRCKSNPNNYNLQRSFIYFDKKIDKY